MQSSSFPIHFQRGCVHCRNVYRTTIPAQFFCSVGEKCSMSITNKTAAVAASQVKNCWYANTGTIIIFYFFCCFSLTKVNDYSAYLPLDEEESLPRLLITTRRRADNGLFLSTRVFQPKYKRNASSDTIPAIWKRLWLNGKQSLWLRPFSSPATTCQNPRALNGAFVTGDDTQSFFAKSEANHILREHTEKGARHCRQCNE